MPYGFLAWKRAANSKDEEWWSTSVSINGAEDQYSQEVPTIKMISFEPGGRDGPKVREGV